MRILFNRGSGTGRALLPNLRGLQEVAIGFSSGGGQQHAATAVAEQSLVVIMGATGTGKSKLSIDVATRFPSEVVNADKIQLYRGLDITTNKIPVPDRRGVPHHLLGELDPAAGEMPPAGFRSLAASVIAGIASRRRIPVVAGGSNSLLHALLADRYDPSFDPFAGEAYLGSRRRQRWLRYRCCFLWVDVDEELLGEHLDQRVDEMVGLGMVEELEAYFAAEGEGAIERHPGLGKAIGVPEFQRYFIQQGMRTLAEYREAVGAIKENTRRRAEAQVRKIKQLGEMGWAMRRVDATGTVRARLNGTGSAAEREAWERDVMGPSLEAVRRFMEEEEEEDSCHHPHQLLPLAAVSSSS